MTDTNGCVFGGVSAGKISSCSLLSKQACKDKVLLPHPMKFFIHQTAFFAFSNEQNSFLFVT